ncbi:MAG: multidrug efflux pump, partial [Actinomycetota bacterium]|nr:multidrug efflux pump [Actinomycetota bacterium]
RGMDRVFGGFFRRFNSVFSRGSTRYEKTVGGVLKRKSAAMVVYALLIVAAFFAFRSVPAGFVPGQDKQYLVGFAQLPDAASLDRTEDVIRRMSDIGLKTAGVESSVAFPGLSINGFVNAPNAGIVFFTLKDFDKRKGKGLSGNEIAMKINQRLGSISDAVIMVFPPPPVNGLGTIGGFKLYVEDRGNVGYDELYKAVGAVQAKAAQTPELAGVFSGFQVNVPQLFADVDRTKAKQLGVPLGDIFNTMQINLGSLYVNDFNKFGRTYQVIVQADEKFRSHAQDLGQMKVKNAKGEMVQLSSLMQLKDAYGPDRVLRYNAYTAADINGAAAPGVSSGQAQVAMEKVLAETLPKGVSYEWTELTFQDIIAGNTMLVVFPLCVMLVFLVLAAQYESWTLPLAVILIVEFARDLEHAGRSIVEAALEACRLRLRPILMTSFAFILGSLPLALASGAGAGARQALGTAVVFGMLAATVVGVFYTPVFYVLMQRISERQWPFRRTDTTGAAGAAGSNAAASQPPGISG